MNLENQRVCLINILVLPAIFVIFLVITVPAYCATDTPIYLDTNQSFEKRVRDLISRLTLEEKAMLLNHRGTTIERFNIRSDQWNQCLHGVCWDRGIDSCNFWSC